MIELILTVCWGSFIFLMSGMDHSADMGAATRRGALACFAFAALGVLLIIGVSRPAHPAWLDTTLLLWCAIPVIFVILMSDNREFPPGWGI
ncbi:MAG: hypothetical protein ABL926_10915 [Novosphingobium sp.]|uniref:hypothetical protein n=1 Tax=Novosphingobium sp. TaxID=1874826 RepID=UPI0032B7B018